jgi:hypothetical protein
MHPLSAPAWRMLSVTELQFCSVRGAMPARFAAMAHAILHI